MSKIVFFNIPASGHVNPSLPVIKALVARGEEVVYVLTEEYRSKVEATGAGFIAYPDLSKMEQLIKEDAGQGNIPRNMRDLVRVSMDLFPFALKVIEQEKPDFLIYDSLASWGKLAVQKLNLASVAFVSTFVITLDSQPPMPATMLLDTMGKMLRVMPSYIADAFKFRSQHGIFPVFLVEAVMSLAEMNIVFTSQEFHPKGEKFSDAYKFVGVSIEPRNDASDFPFDKLTGKPLVYISLGTIAKNEAFIRACFEAFGKHEGQFIISVGKGTNIASLGEIPNNFIVRNHVPQLEILQKVDAFITHGGMNSVHEGLVYGVPMLLVPQQLEQSIVAAELEKHGAGIAIANQPPYGRVTSNELRQALEKLLSSSSYAQNAKKLGESILAAGGHERAADEIIAFAKRIGK